MSQIGRPNTKCESPRLETVAWGRLLLWRYARRVGALAGGLTR
jgi:hypothetical protein